MEDADCPRHEEEGGAPEHIVFRCKNINRVKHIRDRRE